MSNVIIRKFEAADRQAVRDICCDTADRGQPIERIFPDRTFAADLLSVYYTDFEPASVFVAESQGRVIGYVLGSTDNRRYGLVMAWVLGPRFLYSGFRRGLFFRSEIWRMITTACKNWRRLFQWRKKSFHSHEGHLHIGIAEGFRGQRVGQKLVEAFIVYAQQQGTDEIAASVNSKNTAACGFFEHLGFRIRDQYPMVAAHKQGIEHYNALLYVKKIS